ncbi:MAG: phosphoribosylformylglycinamidine synthase subunit PurQ [Phycisphaerales bacterium JB040]
MTDAPRAIVLRSAGTNCDREMVRAFELAGARTDLVHLDALCASPKRLSGYELIGFPGGFSYGDDIASGRIFAARVRQHLYPALRDAAERGVCMIGACNGFQVLVQVGLLPGPASGESWPDTPPAPTVALADNASARFTDRWATVDPDPDAPCVWTRGLEGLPDRVRTLPIAHGEGRLIASPETLERLRTGGHVALRYAEDVNGSADRIAGLCDATGRIFGLMPHPERYLDWNRHPAFTRLDGATTSGEAPGLTMFRNAVHAVSALHA